MSIFNKITTALKSVRPNTQLAQKALVIPNESDEAETVQQQPRARHEVASSLAESIQHLSDKMPDLAQALEHERRGFDSWACMPPMCYEGKDVLDLGCGIGAASVVFLERGANFVWGIDPLLTDKQISILRDLPKSRFTSSLLLPDSFGDQRFDLVYARFVTEHIIDLQGAFSTVFDLLRPGGRFVALHDNYYSPMGAHDHPFIWPANPNEYFYHSKAVPCWESPKKCEASAEFRQEVEQKYDWSIRLWTLTPHDCSQCPYFQRSQLWGHLLYQDSFNQNYPGEFFKTNPKGGLNKVTPFQLRQFLVEAGFKISNWDTHLIANHPTPGKLTQLFPENDLRTLSILFAADKPMDERSNRG